MADAAETTPSSNRTPVFDALKGIGILEVVFHHCTGRSLWKFETKFAPGWWIAVVANEILHFAVPLFLFVSAMLLSRSYSKRPQLRDYVRRRANRTLVPYLVASVGYLAFRALVVHTEGEIRPDWFTRVALPALLYGRAYFHMYFIIVLLQLIAMVPILCWIQSRWQLSFRAWLGAATVLYGGFVILQGWAFTVPSTGSLVVSYSVPIALGVGFGLCPPERFWRTSTLGWLTLATGLIHVGLATAVAAGSRQPTWLVAYAFTAYTATFSVWLWKWIEPQKDEKWIRPLATVGTASMAIYLLHPLAMHYVGGPRLTSIYMALPLSSVWFTLATLTLTLGAIFGYRAFSVWARNRTPG